MAERFTVVVPQGVGDVVWVYQKLAPLCDEIAFRVVDLANQPPAITRRAERIIAALPKVAGVDYLRVEAGIYPPVLGVHRRVADVHADLRAGREVYYAVNPWLEDGVRLEYIDHHLPVAWDLGVVPAEPPVAARAYLALYVSGDVTRHATFCEAIWPPEYWVRFVQALYARCCPDKSAPVVLVGAAFDYPVLAFVWDALTRDGFTAEVVLDLALPDLLGLFRAARLFVGYQSGLNVLADAAGARQLMVYFPRVAKMADTWVNPAHRGTHFRWTTFAVAPAAAATLVDF